MSQSARRRIVHFTTVHPRADPRVRIKELHSLSGAFDADVYLLVQDGLGDDHDVEHDVRVVDTGASPVGLPRRLTTGAWRMFRAVWELQPTVAHFHDPELLPWAMLLRLRTKVVYDVHEDIPRQLMHKHYLSAPLARFLSVSYSVLEKIASRLFDANIVVVPSQLPGFPAGNTTMVSNFPLLEEFAGMERAVGGTRPSDACPRFIYTGAITETRGIERMVEAMGLVADRGARLTLLGRFQPLEFEREVARMDGWRAVDFLGWADRDMVRERSAEAIAGLVILQPTPNYKLCYPVKMFEYMAAGLPVIASDYPVWREIVDEARCGLLVDPLDSAAVATAMEWIIDHPEEARAMGERGREAIERTYNWNSQAAKLIRVYEDLMSVDRKLVEQV